jgi:hypothetical protein
MTTKRYSWRYYWAAHAAIGLLIGLVVSLGATAEAADLRFRGWYVCEQLPASRNILRAPLDLVLHDGEAEFARPLFNLNDPRVVGSELAAGPVDAEGALHVQSRWSLLGNSAAGDYRGWLTRNGGTLSGTQTWTGPQTGGEPVVRTCFIAVVPAPKTRDASPAR